jgi:hypothetical protein
MERSVDRDAQYSEGCTGTFDVADVFGMRVANTILASGIAPRQQAGHLIASDRIETLLEP